MSSASSRSFALLPALSLALEAGCHVTEPPPKFVDPIQPDNSPPVDVSPTAAGPAPGTNDFDETGKSSAADCSGYNMDLVAALAKSACDLPKVKPNSTAYDLKDSLELRVLAPARLAPGGHADIIVTFVNKDQSSTDLQFMLDPTPRFSIEVYDAKGKRADIPTDPQPKIPPDQEKEPTEPRVGRLSLFSNGAATVHIPWDAVKMRWAPENLKGTPPEMGYPRAPAGPLPKGTYTLRILTPLTNVKEGPNREVSTAKATVEVK